MADQGTLTVERSGAVAWVTIRRPERGNSIDVAVAEGIAAAVRDVEADDGIRVAVLRGEGDRFFCTGADLRAAATTGSRVLSIGDAGLCGLTEAARTKPWIAAVNGMALGGGFELALACDLVVAAEHAEFGLPEVSRGLIANAGGVVRIGRRLPYHVAAEMVALGTRLPAPRAHQLGLVNRLATAATLDGEARDVAARICDNAPLAVREALAVLRAVNAAGEAGAFRDSEERSRRLRHTDDYREGVQAFLDKRPPRWTGR